MNMSPWFCECTYFEACNTTAGQLYPYTERCVRRQWELKSIAKRQLSSNRLESDL